jgi:raffinose/stachyose/melibiose transport system permease protein
MAYEKKAGDCMRRITATVFKHAMLIPAAFISLFPLVWMAITSLKSNQEISFGSFSLPKQLHFENYVEAWNTANMSLYFSNSIIVTVVSIFLTILAGSLASFVLSKFKFRLRNFIYTIFIIGMLIPMQSILVPLFIQMRTLHLLDSLWSLILSYTAFGLPVAIFILESFMRVFPDEIMEAAILDGCTQLRIFSEVILPMSRPAVASVTILTFLNNWKEFSFALIFISEESKKTLPLGLYNFLGTETNNYAGLMAALIIATLPVFITYIFLQEQVIKGMTAGAVKG